MIKNKLKAWLPEKGIPFHALIAFSLFLTLSIIASVTLWFYYSNASYMAKQSAHAVLNQQKQLTQLSFDGWMSDTETFVTLARQDPQLISELISIRGPINHTSQQHIEQRLSALIEQHQANQVDLLVYLPNKDHNAILGGSSPYQTSALLNQLRAHLPNTGFHLTLPINTLTSDVSETNQVSGLVFIEEVVAGKFGKRLGYLAGIIVLNDNFQVLSQIIDRTGAQDAALTIDDARIVEPIAWISTQQKDYPSAQNQHELGLGQFIQVPIGEQTISPNLNIQLWNENSYLEAHQAQFQQTLLIVFSLILILGLSIGFFTTRLSGRSLKYLSTFAQQKASTDTHATFEPTAIREINNVGERLEQAIFALTRNEEMYRNILNYSGAIVYIKDLDGKFHFVNTEFECVTGLSMAQVQGKTNEDLFSSKVAAAFTKNDKQVAREERVLNFREDLVRDEHDTISFVSVKFPIRDHNHQLNYICGFSTDITGIVQTQEALNREKERAEEATSKLNTLNKNLAKTIEEKTFELESAQESLIQSEKLASLGALVAGISHELNTPIGTALTVTTTVQERVHELSEDIKSGTLSKRAMNAYLLDFEESGHILYRSLSSAIELIASFKQLSVDQTSQQRRVFSLKQTIEEVTTTHKHLLKSSNIQIIDLIERDTLLDSFPGALIQILNNLLQNAVSHAFDENEAGKISITTSIQDDDVHITLSDDGHGIPTKYLDKIFDPFFTTKMGQGGTGLGLHIVHSITTGILGGKVKINSRHGGINSGTDFLITLPKVAPINTLQDQTDKIATC